MQKVMKMSKTIIIIVFAFLSVTSFAQTLVDGAAFVDINANGIWDTGEKAFAGLHVSNGRDIVMTDKKGRFAIEKIKGRFIFGIKPTGYRFALDEDCQSRFYLHPNSESFHFPLYKSDEPAKFSAILMGDPQVYAQDQINYLGEVATDELLKSDYAFTMVLGDMVGNTLPLLPQVKATLGKSQKACYYAIGNHDRDRGAFDDPAIQDNDSYEAVYGPDYYSFNWGQTHFLVLNNVLTVEPRNQKGSDYVPGIHPMQLEFIKNDLATVPEEKLVVVCAHIPFFFGDKKDKITRLMLEMLQKHPKVFMATGHAHNQIQLFFDEEDGWMNEQPVHQLVAGAICGNWWRGEYDMFGIPGSMMRDGTPRGYWFMHIDGVDYQLEYKASGMDPKKQMHIWVPQHFEMFDSLSSAPSTSKDVWINVYAGNEHTDVKVRFDEGEWLNAERRDAFDPYVLRLLNRQELGVTPTSGARGLKPEARESTHLWYIEMPDKLKKGIHKLEVSATNNYGLNASEHRVFWRY
jgi:hypothetical protein